MFRTTPTSVYWVALVMAGMASGTVLGVPLSLLLAEQAGWQAALWLVTALGTACWLGLAFKLKAISAGPPVSVRSKLHVLTDRRVLSVLLVSLLAAMSSLGMYTFIAPLMADPEHGAVIQITPYLWVWRLGGIAGSFLIMPLVERVSGARLTFMIMLVLTASLLLLPFAAKVSPWLAMLPIALWGAVGWALQVPQNNQLIAAREQSGDGNLAVALNESALYLGSALGSAAGGILLLLQMPSWTLAISAAGVAFVGMLVQALWGFPRRTGKLEQRSVSR